MSSILKINEPISSDTSINEYEHHEYGTIAGTNLNNFRGDIKITIETQDIYTHPSESFLIIDRKMIKDDGKNYADADVISKQWYDVSF